MLSNTLRIEEHAKSYVLNIQNSGSPIDWEGMNNPLYNFPGLLRSEQENIPKISYKEFLNRVSV